MIAIDPAVGEDFVVEHRGAVIGKAGLYRFPEIGFIFRPDAWGKGFAGEALRAIADRAFNRHRLAAIRADVDPRNNACLKLLCRLGFREVGRGARTWLVGDRFTIADAYLGVFVSYLPHFGEALVGLDALARFSERFEARESVRAARAYEGALPVAARPQPAVREETAA
jgi:glutathione S-transferase